jgi:hypothetical protein
MLGMKKIVLALVAGVTLVLLALSQMDSPVYAKEASIQSLGILTHGNRALVSHFDASGLWVPILASSLAGLIFVQLRNRNIYQTAKTSHKEERNGPVRQGRAS